MRERQRTVGFDEYEEGAIITALNDMRNKEIAEERPADFTGELILKILNAPIRKVRIPGPPQSTAGTLRGEEEQRSEADTRRQAGTAARSLRRRDEAL